jgi:dCMP deaminase
MIPDFPAGIKGKSPWTTGPFPITFKAMDPKINFIEVDSPINWDEYFMCQAILASYRSKDPSTKVGAVFVDQHHHQISMGYNGFVAGIDESRLPWGKEPGVGMENQKYGYVVHAEANAILHSNGDLTGSKLYVTHFPCHECAKLVASKKISEVIYLSDKHRDTEMNRIARRIFELTGMKTRQLPLHEALADRLRNHFLHSIRDL